MFTIVDPIIYKLENWGNGEGRGINDRIVVRSRTKFEVHSSLLRDCTNSYRHIVAICTQTLIMVGVIV